VKTFGGLADDAADGSLVSIHPYHSYRSCSYSRAFHANVANTAGRIGLTIMEILREVFVLLAIPIPWMIRRDLSDDLAARRQKSQPDGLVTTGSKPYRPHRR